MVGTVLGRTSRRAKGEREVGMNMIEVYPIHENRMMKPVKIIF
jgi:hypothetical protein